MPASPNHDDRKRPLSMIVLHYTGMRDAKDALQRLCDPASKVSAHYLIDEGGGVVSLVPEERRAWHAGVARWRGESDINSASIGIEIANPGHDFGYPPFPERQIDALIALVQEICGRRKIPPAHIWGHSDVAPSRKKDPGERFPWRRLAEAGLGLWLPAKPASSPLWKAGESNSEVLAMQKLLERVGYGIAPSGAHDDETAKVVSAFQRHFRAERVDGLADASTMDILQRLAQLLEA